MWKELNSFSAAYLVKLCHPWIVFFNTLILWQHFLSRFARIWSLCLSTFSEVWVVFCLWSVSRTMNDECCILYLALPWQNLPQAKHTRYSIFVITDLCWSSSLVYSVLHCVDIVFLIKVLRKHRIFSRFDFVSSLPHIFSFFMCWSLDFSIMGILPDSNLMLPSSPLQCPLPSKLIPCFRDQLWNSINITLLSGGSQRGFRCF